MKKQNFFLAHKQFTLFFILALVIVGVAVFAPWVAPKDPLEAVMLDSLKAPCAEYPLGADKLGRDLLSRVIYGTRTSLVSTLILVATIFVVGTLLGIIAGYFGGWIDQVITTYRAEASLYITSNESILSFSDLQLSSALTEDYAYIRI